MSMTSTQMKRIVHLTSAHTPFDIRIFHKECRTLAQSGYRVSLIAPHTTFEVVDGVEIIPIPHPRRRLVRMTRGVWTVYRAACRLQADLYHFHEPELVPVGILLKLTTRARVVYDVHENYARKVQAKEWLPRPLRGIVSWGIRLFEDVAAALVDGVVTATEHIAVRFPPAKTQVVKNYALLSMTALSSDNQRTYEGNHTLIYTGGLASHKGIYQIIQALAYVQTPQVELIVLGGHDRETAEAIQQLPGWSRVHYYGRVPYETIYRYLHSAAVGLVCNQPVHDYDLAQPNKLFEYMAAGLPVIASNFDLWKEIFEGNECGVTVDPTSPEQIAKAIDYLLSHPEIRRKMGDNARRAVQEKYNWERESLKLLSLYREVLHQC